MRALTEIEAAKFKKTGGTSSQFLKADGSVDSNSYMTKSAADGTYVPWNITTLSNIPDKGALDDSLVYLWDVVNKNSCKMSVGSMVGAYANTLDNQVTQMTFAEAGITAGNSSSTTNNLIAQTEISDIITNTGCTKFIIKPGVTLSNSSTNIYLTVTNGAVYTALLNRCGIGKELTFIFLNELSGSSSTPYYTVTLKGLSNNHNHSFKVPKSGYGSNLMVKVMLTNKSETSPQPIFTDVVYIGDDVLYNGYNKFIAAPRTMSSLNATNIANAFKTTRTVIVSIASAAPSCTTFNLNTSSLVSALKDKLPSGQIHTLVIKNTSTTYPKCITLQFGSTTQDIDIPATGYAVIPLMAIDSYVIPLQPTIFDY